jgi:glutamate racemase
MKTSRRQRPEVQRRELPIGIFDSGIGGLTVVRQIHRVLPHESLVYLGDTARVPYGTKSPSTVVRFACEDTQFLLQQRVKAVVVACNTASAWALAKLEHSFDVPVFGVIEPGAAAALRRSRTRRIGIIGTSATIRSQAYTKAILTRCETAEVFTRACPLLVPLVEEGWVKHAVTQQVLREYLTPLLEEDIDTLVLGCTHYPLLKPAIREVTSNRVQLVDSAESCARYVREKLAAMELLSASRKRGTIQPFVTDEVERFDELAARFLGQKTEPAWKVELMPMA